MQAYNCSWDYDAYISSLTNQTFWYDVIDFFQGTVSLTSCGLLLLG